MNRKRIVLGLITLLLLAAILSASCGGNDMRLEKALKDFSKLTKKENLIDLSLTIYYLSPYTFTLYPISVDDLINRNYDDKIAIVGDVLEGHIDLLNQISNTELILVEYESRINARIYYVFKNKKGRKILDVAMWGDDSSIFVNGVEVQENDVFYDVIIPFLPEDAAKELETYLNRGIQEETADHSE